jgi:methyl-accepting chemotaxis protein
MYHAPVTGPLDGLTERAISLSRDIVEVAGFLDGVDAAARAQAGTLDQAQAGVAQVTAAAAAMIHASEALAAALGAMAATSQSSTERISAVVGSNRSVLDWVKGLEEKLGHVDAAAERTQEANGRILHIAREVNILAINAKIEAARAGAAGKGFAVVADAINALSTQTAQTATLISETVTGLAREIAALRGEAHGIAVQARDGMAGLTAAEDTMGDLTRQSQESTAMAGQIRGEAGQMQGAMDAFTPTFQRLRNSVEEQAKTVVEGKERVSGLIHHSETMVQGLVEAGGASSDRDLIAAVQARAKEISSLFEAAVKSGQISLQELFSTQYHEVPGSNPKQVLAPYTQLTDRLLPPIQEAALGLDPRVVFCAAVDRNGYLPTHNLKFSQPQGRDPVWNAANCRNRRIFNDRVGLGAGQSQAPFLMQLYRRDMGGGKFVMMKDVSAPIFVQRQHWGGLRLAYTL